MPALALLFLGGAKRVLAWLSRRSFWQLVCIGLVVLIVVQRFELAGEKRHSAKVEVQLVKCGKARESDRAAYVKAQAEAASQNKAQVTKIEQTYKRNSVDERQAYLDDLAKLRADRVRAQNSTVKGSAGATIAPQDSAHAPRIDENGLCVPASSDVCETGAEIELRLMHLQNLVEKQLSVDPNK